MFFTRERGDAAITVRVLDGTAYSLFGLVWGGGECKIFVVEVAVLLLCGGWYSCPNLKLTLTRGKIPRRSTNVFGRKTAACTASNAMIREVSVCPVATTAFLADQFSRGN